MYTRVQNSRIYHVKISHVSISLPSILRISGIYSNRKSARSGIARRKGISGTRYTHQPGHGLGLRVGGVFVHCYPNKSTSNQ